MLELLRERHTGIVLALTREYKGGTMTPDKAIGYVAELATVSGLMSVIDGEAKEEGRSSPNG